MASHIKLTIADQLLAEEIDKSVKNKWKHGWRDSTVKTTVKFLRGKEVVSQEIELRVGDVIDKIHRPGEACVCGSLSMCMNWVNKGQPLHVCAHIH